MNCFDCIKDEHAIDPCHRTYQQLYDDTERWGRSLTRRTKALRRLGGRYMRVCRELESCKQRLAAYECELRDYGRTVQRLRSVVDEQRREAM